jgi:PhnB protein
MSVNKVTPYLLLNGTAQEAIRLYEQALDAKVENFSRYGDVSVGRCAEGDKNRVMHACLRIGKELLMVSDLPADKPAPAGSNVHVCLDFDDPQEMARRFEALAASGKVCMGLHDAFWGAKFGTLTDAHGVHWMFNCTNKA